MYNKFKGTTCVEIKFRARADNARIAAASLFPQGDDDDDKLFVKGHKNWLHGVNGKDKIVAMTTTTSAFAHGPSTTIRRTELDWSLPRRATRTPCSAAATPTRSRPTATTQRLHGHTEDDSLWVPPGRGQPTSTAGRTARTRAATASSARAELPVSHLPFAPEHKGPASAIFPFPPFPSVSTIGSTTVCTTYMPNGARSVKSPWTARASSSTGRPAFAGLAIATTGTPAARALCSPEGESSTATQSAGATSK